MNYFQWFIKKGWKPYCVPFAIVAWIDYGVSKEFQSIIDLPVIGIIFASVSIIGANIVLPYHSIQRWKLDNQPTP